MLASSLLSVVTIHTEVHMKRGHRSRARARGMTLIEIMVVIAILASITAAVAIQVIPRLNEAKRDRALLDLKSLESALTAYYVRTGHHPRSEEGLSALVTARILDEIPVDPWGMAYLYALENGEPVVTTHGADGAPGGENFEADLSTRSNRKHSSPVAPSAVR